MTGLLESCGPQVKFLDIHCLTWMVYISLFLGYKHSFAERICSLQHLNNLQLQANVFWNGKWQASRSLPHGILQHYHSYCLKQSNASLQTSGPRND